MPEESKKKATAREFIQAVTVTHFTSPHCRRAACGELMPRLWSQDIMLVTCVPCAKAVVAAGKKQQLKLKPAAAKPQLPSDYWVG